MALASQLLSRHSGLLQRGEEASAQANPDRGGDAGAGAPVGTSNSLDEGTSSAASANFAHVGMLLSRIDSVGDQGLESDNIPEFLDRDSGEGSH